MYLISHFYNEEFLLPHWIKHHKPLFDHAVMIDYRSTDRSVEIIKELAPEWEIRTTKNQYFEEPYIGLEVEEIEREFDGWKMVLNTTEFLLHPNLKQYVASLESQQRRAMRATGVIIVDHPDNRSTYEEPLILTKTFGYMEEDCRKQLSTVGSRHPSRSRVIHNHPSGKYGPGRHTNQLTQEIDPNFVLCWFGWSPFDYVKERKKQIQYKVSGHQKAKERWADLYCVDDEKLERMYEAEWTRSYDLLTKDIYRTAYNTFKESLR